MARHPSVPRSAALGLFACALNLLAATPAFEVASVKPADPGNRIVDFQIQPGGRLLVTNWTLLMLIDEAYSVKPYQIGGGPPWLDVDRYDITAKAQGNPTRDQVLIMLRTLLQERFQLQVHRETKTGTVYHLVVAKGGAKLVASKSDRQPFAGIIRPAGARAGKVIGIDAPLTLVADYLSRYAVEGPVLNKTGLKGNYDIDFEFHDQHSEDSGPSLFTAIQKEIGLKLDARRGPVETIRVEQAVKPAAN